MENKSFQRNIFNIETESIDTLKEKMGAKGGEVLAFNSILIKLMDHSDIYYVETVNDSAIVRKRIDDSIVYQTKDKEEFLSINRAGLKKNPDISEPTEDLTFIG